jgi:spore maturation protein CgeB
MVYYDIADLKRKVRYYLRNPDERKEMARRSQKLVYEKHTYRHRFEEMLDTIGRVL